MWLSIQACRGQSGVPGLPQLGSPVRADSAGLGAARAGAAGSEDRRQSVPASKRKLQMVSGKVVDLDMLVPQCPLCRRG
jgi:hypothetical protein